MSLRCLSRQEEPPLIYSKDEVLREITSFYDFLTKLHVPSSAVRFPPPEGWPSIDAQSYAFLRKNDTAIDLLRHLPYIDREDSDGYEVYELTAMVDYEGTQMRSDMRIAEEHGQEPDMSLIEPASDEGMTAVPPYVISLASETCGADGYWFLLDTNRGTMTLYGSWETEGSDCRGTVKNEVIYYPIT